MGIVISFQLRGLTKQSRSTVERLHEILHHNEPRRDETDWQNKRGGFLSNTVELNTYQICYVLDTQYEQLWQTITQTTAKFVRTSWYGLDMHRPTESTGSVEMVLRYQRGEQ
jgi:hypothetical protein